MELSKFCTRKELADAYGISRNTLTKRLDELGIKERDRLSPKDLITIFEELGTPYSVERYLANDPDRSTPTK